MNRILKGLLVTALAVSAAQVSAYTNKTFLMPRPVGVDLPMEMTTFKELAHHKGHNRFGGTFAVTGFYQSTNSENEAAKYFLLNNKSTITLSEGPAAGALSTNDGDLGYIIHDYNNSSVNNLPVTVNLKPEQDVYGARFDYHQCLGKILKGLYLYANMPVAHVENDLKLKVGGTVANYATTVATPATSVQTVLTNYFNGTFSNTIGAGTSAAVNLQSALTNAKIAGKRGATGVADIDLGLGYKFLHKERYHAALAIAFTIPTGNEATGTYAFEPIYGNGDHFGLGGDFCAGVRAWGDCDHNIKLNLTLKYRYLFESREKRTLGIVGAPFGQYALLIPAGATGSSNTSLVPAANVTTKNVDVTPGSQLDGVLGFAYNNGGFSFDLGYNLYFREAESLKLKDTFVAGSYAIAARNVNTWTATTATPIVAGPAVDTNAPNPILSASVLDFSAASTPSQFTNSIYTGLGYSFKEWDTPLMLGLGGKYEWANDNSAFDQWNLYGKVGIGF